jgi:RNA chaperone ProQ/FINO-like protein
MTNLAIKIRRPMLTLARPPIKPTKARPPIKPTKARPPVKSIKSVKPVKDHVVPAAPAKPKRVWARKPSAEAIAIRERADQVRRELERRFPACFASHKPLAIGIAELLYDACPDIAKHDLVNVLSAYTTETGYYLATVTNAERVDLNGAAAGVVTPLAAARARARLRRLGINGAA